MRQAIVSCPSNSEVTGNLCRDLRFQGSQFKSGDYTLNLYVSGPHRDAGAQSTGKPFQPVLSLGYVVSNRSAAEFGLLASEQKRQVQSIVF